MNNDHKINFDIPTFLMSFSLGMKLFLIHEKVQTHRAQVWGVITLSSFLSSA